MNKLLLVLLVAVAVPQGFAQSSGGSRGSGSGITISTVANLPAAPPTGSVAVVTNGASTSDCTVGGGSTLVFCRFGGATWGIFPAGSAGAGGSTTQLQWNNATALGGIAQWTTNGTTTITGSATAVLDLSAMSPIAGLKLPTAAGAAPTADGFLAINSTTHLPAFGSNGATLVYPATNAGSAHQFFTAFNNQTGVFTLAQPLCADLSNAAASCATDATNAANIGSGTLAAARMNPSVSAHTFLGNITAGAAAASFVRPACGDLSDSSGGCSMSTTAAGDVSGTLPTLTVVAINGNTVPASAVADQLLVGTAANTFSLKTLTNCTGGASAVSYATSTHAPGCLASIITGTLTSTRVPFSNGTNGLTDSANLTYAAGSGFTQIQGANGTDANYIKRFTDTSPTGNFLHFQDAAALNDLFKVDILGNVTGTSFSSSNPAGNAGQLSLVQGTAPSAVANAVNIIASTSVTTYTLTLPGTVAAGFWNQTAGGVISYGTLTGDASSSGFTVTNVKLNGVSYAAGPATTTIPEITAANTATYRAIADCGDATHALAHTAASGWACQAITATASAGAPTTSVQFNSGGALAGSANLEWVSPVLTIGAAGVTGQLSVAGSTSGATAIQSAAAASGTLTLPAATDTLIGKATTDVLTNKTLDTAGAGNVLKINGTTVSTKTGTGAVVLATSPALTTPDLGTPSAVNLSNATSLAGAAVPVVNTVVDTASPVTISATLSAEFHYNENATAATAMTYNLPTAAAGKQFCISNAFNGTAPNTGVLTVATSAAGQFITFTDGTLSATGGNITSGGAAADAACVVGIDSTHWMLYVQRGTWTKH